MAERTYRLTFKTPFYVGVLGVEREASINYIPSDTLFGAFVVALSRLNPQSVAEFLQPFQREATTPPLLFSSTFPFAGSVRFFPRPQRYFEDITDLPFKRIKKAAWVSEAIFNHLRQGEFPVEHLDEKINFIQGKQVWLTQAERELICDKLEIADDQTDPRFDIRLWSQAVSPRVTVDRADNSSNLFHTGRVQFRQGCGLWFAARGDNLDTLDPILAFLQDEGVGGMRGTGHGAFEVEIWNEAAVLPIPENGGNFVTLARYAPGRSEFAQTIQAEKAAYKLVTVGGWCHDDRGHPWRRKQVRLIAEGACLGWPGYTPGKLVTVTPSTDQAQFDRREVYRYGFAFPVAAD